MTSLMVFVLVSCQNIDTKRSPANKQELIKETNHLMMLHDSFNKTGDYKILNNYALYLDSLIEKYPNEVGFKMVRKQIYEIYGDSIE